MLNNLPVYIQHESTLITDSFFTFEQVTIWMMSFSCHMFWRRDIHDSALEFPSQIESNTAPPVGFNLFNFVLSNLY